MCRVEGELDWTIATGLARHTVCRGLAVLFRYYRTKLRYCCNLYIVAFITTISNIILHCVSAIMMVVTTVLRTCIINQSMIFKFSTVLHKQGLPQCLSEATCQDLMGGLCRAEGQLDWLAAGGLARGSAGWGRHCCAGPAAQARPAQASV